MDETPTRLNLGSGPHYADGWLNVDLHDPPEGYRKPDYYADVYHLSDHFEAGTFTAVYLGHFLEHLEWGRIPDALDQIRKVAKPGAVVMAVGPCILRTIRYHPSSVDLIKAILADPEATANAAPGCCHEWTPTEYLTRRALERGGLIDVVTVPVVGVTKPQWPNPSTAQWQTAAQGLVP